MKFNLKNKVVIYTVGLFVAIFTTINILLFYYAEKLDNSTDFDLQQQIRHDTHSFLETQEQKIEKSQKADPWPRQKIGPHGWTILHLAVARLPFDLSPEEQDRFKIFMHLFANFYPCKLCGAHFAELLKQYPPNVETREQGILYMCKMHNHVNERLEKPQVPCGTNLFELWGGNDDCGCGQFNIQAFDETHDQGGHSNETHKSNNTHIHVENHILNDSHTHEENHISNDSHTHEENHISNEIHINDETHNSNETVISHDSHISHETPISHETHISDESHDLRQNISQINEMMTNSSISDDQYHNETQTVSNQEQHQPNKETPKEKGTDTDNQPYQQDNNTWVWNVPQNNSETYYGPSPGQWKFQLPKNQSLDHLSNITFSGPNNNTWTIPSIKNDSPWNGPWNKTWYEPWNAPWNFKLFKKTKKNNSILYEPIDFQFHDPSFELYNLTSERPVQVSKTDQGFRMNRVSNKTNPSQPQVNQNITREYLDGVPWYRKWPYAHPKFFPWLSQSISAQEIIPKVNDFEWPKGPLNVSTALVWNVDSSSISSDSEGYQIFYVGPWGTTTYLPNGEKFNQTDVTSGNFTLYPIMPPLYYDMEQNKESQIQLDLLQDKTAKTNEQVTKESKDKKQIEKQKVKNVSKSQQVLNIENGQMRNDQYITAKSKKSNESKLNQKNQKDLSQT